MLRKSKAKAARAKAERRRRARLCPGPRTRGDARTCCSRNPCSRCAAASSTLSSRPALHLASAEGINVPADFQEDAVEIAVALVAVKQALRGYVRRRRAAYADAAATGQRDED